MEIYLLKSAACLAIFFAFYKIFMENESFHVLKRVYLLAGLMASFLIPLVTFTSYVEVSPVTTTVSFIENGGTVTASELIETTNYLPTILWSLYFLGVVFFSLKFFKNLFSLVRKIQNNPNIKSENVFHVLLKLPITPHTFFSYIFLNQEKFQKKEIPQEVLIHEQAHAVQKHSLDILFIELLQIVFWFNPLLYAFKHSIKLNHEFLADHAVLHQGNETVSYQKILLAFSSNATPPSMANSIHYSPSRLNELFFKDQFGQVKKRFTVMKTHTSKRAVWLKTLLLLPLVTLLLYGFSTTETVEKQISNTTVKQQPNEHWFEDIIEEDSSDNITLQEIAKYNKMAAYWNERFEQNPQNRVMPLSQLKELETIYRSMNVLQKQNAEPFPSCDIPSQSNMIDNILAEKSLVIMVSISEISINGKKSSLKTFANDLDAVTKSWEETDYTSTIPQVYVASTPQEFLEKLEVEFKKTHLSKANGGMSLIPPPPPPPPAPKSPDAKKAQLPPPPPPPSKDLGTEVMRKYKNSIVLYVNEEDIYLNGKKTALGNFTNALNEHTKNWTKEDFKLFGLATEKVNVSDAFINKLNSEYQKSNLAKQSTSKRKYLIGDNTLLSPPPPPPPGPSEPLDHIIAMAKRGASFYYEKESITSDKAIALLKKNSELNIQTRLQDPKPPRVFISKEGITIED